jgi:hypothetical protein
MDTPVTRAMSCMRRAEQASLEGDQGAAEWTSGSGNSRRTASLEGWRAAMGGGRERTNISAKSNFNIARDCHVI